MSGVAKNHHSNSKQRLHLNEGNPSLATLLHQWWRTYFAGRKAEVQPLKWLVKQHSWNKTLGLCQYKEPWVRWRVDSLVQWDSTVHALHLVLNYLESSIQERLWRPAASPSRQCKNSWSNGLTQEKAAFCVHCKYHMHIAITACLSKSSPAMKSRQFGLLFGNGLWVIWPMEFIHRDSSQQNARALFSSG